MLIIALHTSPFESSNKYISFFLSSVITRWGVPFFFIAAGFLYALKRENTSYFQKYIKKLIISYAIWCVIYMPHRILHILQNNIQFFTFDYLKTLLNDVFYNGFYQHMWFVPALIFSVAIVELFARKQKTNLLLAICIPLYILGAIGGMWGKFLIQTPFGILFGGSLGTRNGLFLGLPLTCIGFFMYKNRNKASKKVSIYALCIGAVLNIAEVYIASYLGLVTEFSYGISTLLVPLGAMLICISLQCTSDRIKKFMRFSNKYCMGLFYLHPLVLYAWIFVTERLQISFLSRSEIRFCICFGFTQVFLAIVKNLFGRFKQLQSLNRYI